MQSGILLMDKPAGISSAKALNRLKQRLPVNKIGHSGTLDPMATGLLVVLINSATRLAAYAEAGEKIYSGTIRLGLATDSDDITGEVVSECGEIPDFERVREASRRFVGRQDQLPPSVSALKIEGQRAYQMVRAGLEPQLRRREVQIHELEISPEGSSSICFKMRCSKGTYVRALARDLGKDLGCGACLSSLRRLGSAPFSVGQAKPPDNLNQEDLLDWKLLFPEVPRVELELKDALLLSRGNEEALRAFLTAHCINNSKGLVIYTGPGGGTGFGSGWPCGILVNQDGKWRFGVNLRE
jgi:tRNA pseudouridine55 synthase